MTNLSVKVSGGQGLAAALQKRGANLERTLLDILETAADPIAEDARRRATSAQVRGAIIVQPVNPSTVGVGPDLDRTHIGHLLELGVAPHQIGSPGQVLLIRGRYPVRGPVSHPGHAPRPYLRPAYDTNADKARQVFAKRAKEAMDL